jgi:hypothetical protein
LAAASLLCDSECWAITKGQLQQIEGNEMRFLRPVAGYRRIDQMRTEAIRQELNIFDLCAKYKCIWTKLLLTQLKNANWLKSLDSLWLTPKRKKERRTIEEMEDQFN